MYTSPHTYICMWQEELKSFEEDNKAHYTHTLRTTYLYMYTTCTLRVHYNMYVCTRYREIRQEVVFLSALDHPHLTQLCGVRTRPSMCLLLELAPLGSLRLKLKEYLHHNLVLEPLTLKMTTLQVHTCTVYCMCVYVQTSEERIQMYLIKSVDCSTRKAIWLRFCRKI